VSSHVWWYVARAGGLVAWGLIVASCAWGLLHAMRTFGRRPSPSWMLSTHRYLSTLAIVFVAVHVIALLADSYVQFSVTDVLVPFTSPWHPVAVAWGVIGLYVLVAVEITSLLRARMSPKVWRNVHLLSYVLLALVTIHLLAAGTDATDLLPTTSAVLIGVATVFGAAMLLTWRSAPKLRPTPGPEPVTGR
jgi:DMSO/TMAO reductase YedYZ heme-binding membrane subunit